MFYGYRTLKIIYFTRKGQVNVRGFKGGTAPPTPKLAYVTLYPKISTPFWKIIYASNSKLSKELQNGIEFLVGQAAFESWIKQ